MSEEQEIKQIVTDSQCAATSGTGDATITITNYYYYREDVKVAPVPIDGTDANLPCPYRGLRYFEPNDAEFFFGREVFVTELLHATETRNFIPVLGASGSGKSSVVLAGLVPKLQEKGHWKFTHFRPGNDPFHALALALVPLYTPELDATDRMAQARKLADYFREGTIPLADIFAKIKQNHPNDRVLLIADQFEELYTLCSDEIIRRSFLDRLLASFPAPNSQLSCSAVLVATMRADFLGNALSYRPFADLLQNADIKLGAMNREELSQVIEKPADKLGVKFADGLVKRILDSVENEPGNLPLLEFALTELWAKRKGKELTHAAYEEIGEVQGALTTYANDKYKKFNSSEQKQVQRIFVQLVHPGEGVEDTRRLAIKAELGEQSWSLVKQLADDRLVVTSRNSASIETVEVVHEALIKNWGQLQEWMSADRDFRSWQERLRAAMRQWQEAQQDEGALLRGVPLAVAESWLQKRPDELSLGERDFIEKSLTLRDREKQEKERRRQLIILGLSAGLIGALSLSWWQWQQTEIRDLVTSSQLLLQSNKELDGLIESLKATQKLKKAFFPTIDSRLRVITTLRQAVYDVREVNRLEKYQSEVKSVIFIPNHKILTASQDGTMKIWNQDGSLNQELIGHNGTVLSVSFNQKEQIIASSGADKTVKLWRKKEGVWLNYLTLTGHTDKVRAVSFSPNGQIIASSGNDGTIKFWNLDGKLLNTIRAKQDSVQSMSFRPDGKTLATGGSDSTVKFWRSENGTFEDVKPEPLSTLKAHDRKVWSIDFSHDGKMLATGGGDGTIKLWRKNKTSISDDWIKDLNLTPDEKTKNEICENGVKRNQDPVQDPVQDQEPVQFSCLKGSKDFVRGVRFSPDDQIIAAATWDKRVLLWYWDKPGTTFKSLNGHEKGVWGVSFSSDGKIIASASADNTVKLWNRDETQQSFGGEGGDGHILDVSFSPDGQTIASANECKIIKLRDRKDGRLKEEFVDPKLSPSPDPNCDNRTKVSHKEKVKGVAFSPNGQIIVSASVDCTVKLWRYDGQFIKILTDPSMQSKTGNCSSQSSHSNEVQGVAFSQDGEVIASASSDKTIKLWRKDGNWITTLKGHNGKVYRVSFSPDGKTLASASADNTVKLWRKAGQSWEYWKTLEGHKNSVKDVTFSPDGTRIASASFDKTIILWSKDGQLLKKIYGHYGEVESLSFSSDSQMIASGSTDRTVKIWNRDGIFLNTINLEIGPVYSVSFSRDKNPDKNTTALAVGSDDGKVRWWEMDLDKLQQKACNHVRAYLHNPSANVDESDRHLCDGIGTEK